MKRFLLASVATVALIGTASAADLGVRKAPPMAPPTPAPFSWTGCFIGAHGGWGWGRNDVDEAEHFRSFLFDFDANDSGRVGTSGALFGGRSAATISLDMAKPLAISALGLSASRVTLLQPTSMVLIGIPLTSMTRPKCFV
jgi:opacity protein-like surface antigen